MTGFNAASIKRPGKTDVSTCKAPPISRHVLFVLTLEASLSLLISGWFFKSLAVKPHADFKGQQFFVYSAVSSGLKRRFLLQHHWQNLQNPDSTTPGSSTNDNHNFIPQNARKKSERYISKARIGTRIPLFQVMEGILQIYTKNIQKP